MDKWDYRFLKLADHVAQWSKDPSTQTAAIIVDADKRVVSLGYNGFPKGVVDSEARYNDRETKYKMVVHCEINAIISAGKRLDGCTLYTTPFMTCSNCAGIVIQSGIKRVVTYPTPKDKLERWKESFDLTHKLYTEAGVEFEYGAIRGFQGDYRFLSNFYPCKIEMHGHVFHNSEALYMAHKSNDPTTFEQFSKIEKASEAKLLGRALILRPDWDAIKNQVMYDVLTAKFTQNADLRQMLLDTKTLYLEETNTWNDTYWGICNGKGFNQLGFTLMKVREELSGGKYAT